MIVNGNYGLGVAALLYDIGSISIYSNLVVGMTAAATRASLAADARAPDFSTVS